MVCFGAPVNAIFGIEFYADWCTMAFSFFGNYGAVRFDFYRVMGFIVCTIDFLSLLAYLAFLKLLFTHIATNFT